MNVPFDTRLMLVRKRFLVRFPEGLTLIDNCLSNRAADRWHDDCRPLLDFIHKLAGTAGCFGFDIVGQAALTFEETLTDALRQPTLGAETIGAARRMRQVLSTALAGCDLAADSV